jgi:hypothetical protein
MLANRGLEVIFATDTVERRGVKDVGSCNNSDVIQ